MIVEVNKIADCREKFIVFLYKNMQIPFFGIQNQKNQSKQVLKH